MSEASSTQPESLAALIDSRPDLREILSSNFNLAHAILLMPRGESEPVERALELAVAQGSEGTEILAECIRIEMVRLSGEPSEALRRAEVLARKERFSPMAVLYFRNLFPTMDPSRPRESDSVVVGNASSPPPPEADPIQSEAEDSQALQVENSVAADHQPDEAPLPVADADLPANWNKIGADFAVQFLRIHGIAQQHEVRRSEIGTGVLEEITFGLTGQILEHLSFGALKHSSFEGSIRTIHAWRRDDLRVSAVIQAGPSASLLAARCARAFEDHT